MTVTALDSAKPPAPLQPGEPTRSARRRQLLTRLKRFPALTVGAILLLIMLIACMIYPLLASLDPYSTDTDVMLLGPSGAHLMGTDNVGRDLLSRVLIGGQVSLTVGFAVAIISGATGFVAGLYSAYYPRVGYVIMRVCDGLMAFPAILFGIVLMGAFGQSIQNVILALSVVFFPYVARVVRSSAMTVKGERFVEVLVNVGASNTRILWGNIARNVISPWLIQVTFIFADAILVEAAMSFIGAGIPAPTPSWGNMLYDARNYLYQAGWMLAFPGAALAITVLGINLFGDGLREWLDPKGRR